MGKVPREELLFTQLLIRTGLLTIEQYQEILEYRIRVLEEKGVRKPLDELVIEKGYVDRKVVENLRQKVGYSGRQDDIAQMIWQEDALEKPPTPIGYRIGEKLGEGAMGSVFRAYSEKEKREVAIKFLDPKYNKDKELVTRFIREAKEAQKLHHPNIIGALASGEYKKVYYLVMEYFPGVSLAKILEREGVLKEERALKILRQIALALEYAHKQGVIHRDIKPENILVDNQDIAKLCDFGLARALESESLITRVGSFLGTPHYVSPEQARGVEDIDYRADIYSLGCTFFQMVTGRLPYTHKNPVVILTYQATKPFPNPLEIVPTLSSKSVYLIRKMTEKDRMLRIPSASVLLEAIEKEEPIEDFTKTRISSRRPSTRRRVTSTRKNKQMSSTKRRHRESSSSYPSYKRLRESSSSYVSYRKLRESTMANAPRKKRLGKIAIFIIILGIILGAILILFYRVRVF